MRAVYKRTGFSGFAVLAALAAISIDGQAQGLGPPASAGSAPVTIVNPLPVPVSGSVSGSVAITNTPLPVQGTVGLTSGTVVTIGNTATNPVPVRVDADPRTPFMATVRCDDSSNSECSATAEPVPAGKRLILEYVNASMQQPNQTIGVGIQTMDVRIDGTQTAIRLPATLIGAYDKTSNYRSSERVLMFVEAGKTLSVRFNGWSSNTSGYALLSGYLVDAK
jgi:hypothetical protein